MADSENDLRVAMIDYKTRNFDTPFEVAYEDFEKAIAEIKADAYAEGFQDGEEWSCWSEMDGNPETEPSRDNPYREGD